MLFNLFGKKRKEEISKLFKDKVYINNEGKMNACVQLAKEHKDAIFLAWFNCTRDSYQSYFIQNDIDPKRVIAADMMTPEILEKNIPVFLEHHPLLAKEEALTTNWLLSDIWVFSAMDEPLFKHFGSDKMIPLIKLFGMKENEAIEHSYVTESILKGQHKIAAKVLDEQQAISQAEWMDKNMKTA